MVIIKPFVTSLYLYNHVDNFSGYVNGYYQKTRLDPPIKCNQNCLFTKQLRLKAESGYLLGTLGCGDVMRSVTKHATTATTNVRLCRLGNLSRNRRVI